MQMVPQLKGILVDWYNRFVCNVGFMFPVELKTKFVNFNVYKWKITRQNVFYCHTILVSTGATCWHKDSIHAMAITIKLCYCSNVSLLLYNLLPHVGIKSGWAFLFGSIPTSWTMRTFKEMLLPKNITTMKAIEYGSFQQTFCIKFHET